MRLVITALLLFFIPAAVSTQLRPEPSDLMDKYDCGEFRRILVHSTKLLRVVSDMHLECVEENKDDTCDYLVTMGYLVATTNRGNQKVIEDLCRSL